MRRFSASPRLSPPRRGRARATLRASQLRFGTHCVAALPETPGPAASDTELGKQSETPLLSEVDSRCREESQCALGTGIAHLRPLQALTGTEPRVSLSVRVCVHPRVHVYPSAQEALAPPPAAGRTRIREPGWRVAKPGRGRVNRGARRIRLLFSGWVGLGSPAAGGLQSTERSACGWRSGCACPPPPHPDSPAAHLPGPARPALRAICRLSAFVSSRAWRPGRHPRGPELSWGREANKECLFQSRLEVTLNQIAKPGGIRRHSPTPALGTGSP